VIIDHLGRPFQGTPEEHAVVVGWAKRPNTVMKLSSLPEKTQYPHRDIAPVIKALTDAYGSDRLIYGGGYGEEATGASYRAQRERLLSYLAHLNAEDQAKVLGGTAARLFGFVRA
jgi:predicted TIM-barrel fold metal-dependent hydrolase